MIKVLVVDDEPDLAVLLCTLLEHHGCHAEWCGFGDIAVQKAEEFSPQFVLCDVCIGLFSGIEIAKKIKASLPNCRIVLMTGAEVEQGDADTFAGLFDEVLRKPFEPVELMRAIGIKHPKIA